MRFIVGVYMQPINIGQWWKSLLTRHGLEEPDGRPVFRYRITDEEFDWLRPIIRSRAGTIEQGFGEKALSAAFVCYCAEWYKRNNETAFREWKPLLTPVSINLPVNMREVAVAPGLSYLRQRVRRSGTEGRQSRQWLLTIALQAGLPVRLLTNEKEGWLKGYLVAILEDSFRHSTLTSVEAREIAERYSSHLSEMYRRDEDFLSLAGELCLTLFQLKAKTPQNFSEGERWIEWLNKEEPDWRDNLPMVLGDDAVVLALEGLVREAQKAAGTERVGDCLEAVRGIKIQNGQWQPFVQLEISGTVKLPHAHQSGGRLQLWPIGALGETVAKAVAVVDPLAMKTDFWRIKRTISVRDFVGVPLERDVKMEFRGPALNAHMQASVKNAQALRQEVLVFEQTELGRAIQAGSGSVSSRALTLLALVPRDCEWSFCEPENAHQLVDPHPIASWPDGRKILEIKSSIYLSPRGAETRYRIDPGTDPQSTQLSVVECSTKGWKLLDRGRAVAESPIAVQLVNNGEPVKLTPDDVQWRAKGEKNWTCILASQPAPGLVRVRWRDNQADVTRDSQSVLVLPKGFSLSIKSEGSQFWVKQSVHSDVTFDPDPQLAKCEHDGSFSSLEGRLAKIKGLLSFANGSVEIVAEIKPDRPSFVDGTGRVLPSSKLTWQELKNAEAIAYNPKTDVLRIERIKTPKLTQDLSEVIAFPTEGALSIAQLEPLISQLRSLEGSIDSKVKIAFWNMKHSILDRQAFIELSAFEPMLRLDGSGVDVGDYAANDQLTCAFRPLVSPSLEVCKPLTEVFQFKGMQLLFPPAEMNLPALAYIRDGDHVVTRPRLIPNSFAEGGAGGIGLVLAEPNYEKRALALKAWFKEQDPMKAASLVYDVAISLRGLPAGTLDILQFAPNHVLALAFLKASNEAEVEIFDLENQLPFAWSLISLNDWRQATDIFGLRLFEELPESFSLGDRAALCRDHLSRRLSAIVRLEPNLDTVFSVAVSTWQRKHDVLPAPLTAELNMQGAVHDYLEDPATPYDPDKNMLGEWVEAPKLAARHVLGLHHAFTPRERLNIWRVGQLFPEHFRLVYSSTILAEKR
jgi:hypothetical protein